MIHVNLFEMLDDLSRHVDRMRRDAATIVPESLAAITLREQADAIERRFLTDEQTGEVFPFEERGRAIWIARVIDQEERMRGTVARVTPIGAEPVLAFGERGE